MRQGEKAMNRQVPACAGKQSGKWMPGRIRVMICLLLLFCPAASNAAGSIQIQAAATQFVGGEFRVDILIHSVNDLYGMAFDLLYDPDVLEPADADPGVPGIQPKIQEGGLFSQNGADPTYLKVALEDGMPGNLVIGLSRSGDAAGVTSAEQALCLSVFFRARHKGNTAFAVDRQGLRDFLNQEISGTSWGQLAVNVQEYNWIGDVDQSMSIDLGDVLLVLKALSGSTEKSIYVNADIDGDGKIGMEEAIRALQE